MFHVENVIMKTCYCHRRFIQDTQGACQKGKVLCQVLKDPCWHTEHAHPHCRRKALLVTVRTHLPGATVLGTETKLAVQHDRQRIKTQCQISKPHYHYRD